MYLAKAIRSEAIQPYEILISAAFADSMLSISRDEDDRTLPDVMLRAVDGHDAAA